MTDPTVPLPLSGEEIKVAILDKVSQALDRDCFLHPASAYDFFEGKVSIRLVLHDLGREDIVNVVGGATAGTEVPEAGAHVTSIDIEKQPPNQVRVETGQGVPTQSGKKIKYARTVAEKKLG